MTDSPDPARHIDVGAGVRLHVRDVGRNRPTFVFLHYWGGSARTWQPVADLVAESHRCVAYDQRGWGRSSAAPGTTFTLDDLAADATAVTDALRLDDYVLVGHSMGGKVAQAVAARRPVGLRGVVLVAPAPATPVVSLSVEAREQLLASYSSREAVLAAVDDVLTHRPLSRDLREQVAADSTAGTPEATRAWPMETIVARVEGDLERIDVPVLVIGAEHDVVEPVSLLREHVVPVIPGAQLIEIADSGHLIPLEQPQELAARLLAFAGDLRGDGGAG